MQTTSLVKFHRLDFAAGATAADREPPPVRRQPTPTARGVFAASDRALAGGIWARLSKAA